MRTQVTFDCADPHAQAAFWAQVFGSAVEDHSAFVDQLVADGRMPEGDRIMVNGRSAFRPVAAGVLAAGVDRLALRVVGDRPAAVPAWGRAEGSPPGSDIDPVSPAAPADPPGQGRHVPYRALVRQDRPERLALDQHHAAPLRDRAPQLGGAAATRPP